MDTLTRLLINFSQGDMQDVFDEHKNSSGVSKWSYVKILVLRPYRAVRAPEDRGVRDHSAALKR